MEAEDKLLDRMVRDYRQLPGDLDFPELVGPSDIGRRAVLTEAWQLDATLVYYRKALARRGAPAAVVVVNTNNLQRADMREVLAKHADWAACVYGNRSAKKFLDQGCVVCCPANAKGTAVNDGAIRRMLHFAASQGFQSVSLDAALSETERNLYRFDPKYLENNLGPLSYVYARLADRDSRLVLLSEVRMRSVLSWQPALVSPYAHYLHPLAMPPRGSVVYEGGIADGVSTDALLAETGVEGRLVAFEPSSRYMASLRKKYAGTPHVTLVEAGLYDGEGAAYLDDHGPSSTLSEKKKGDANAVRLLSIDEYEAKHATGCDFIKLDIEGAEVACLRGAMKTIRKCRPRMAICVYHRQEHLWQIPMMIDQCGVPYRMYLGSHAPLHTEKVLYAVPEGP